MEKNWGIYGWTAVMLFGNAWTDWKQREISLGCTGLLAGAGLLRLGLRGELGAEGSRILVLGLALLLGWVLCRGRLGLGDVWLLWALRAAVPFWMWMRVLWSALLVSGIAVLIQTVQKPGKALIELPLAPFVLLGYMGEWVRQCV